MRSKSSPEGARPAGAVVATGQKEIFLKSPNQKSTPVDIEPKTK